jgi:hypothetical protein
VRARVLTVLDGTAGPHPVYVDVSVDTGPPTFVVHGVRLRSLTDLAELMQMAFRSSGILWPSAAIRAQLWPQTGHDFPSEATLALAVGILGLTGDHERIGALGTLMSDGTVSGEPLEATVAVACGYCDRILVSCTVKPGRPALTRISALAEVRDALMTNGPP